MPCLMSWLGVFRLAITIELLTAHLTATLTWLPLPDLLPPILGVGSVRDIIEVKSAH